jgi:hypothetical protein
MVAVGDGAHVPVIILRILLFNDAGQRQTYRQHATSTGDDRRIVLVKRTN